ncbi:MAG TPA: erythromycin esterase family protein [Chitinophaga sp.]|nr:erythromycin esterase family protein [Chitinophaga sp.]
MHKKLIFLLLLLTHNVFAQEMQADTRNYEAFRKSISPLISQMGNKKFVGLGEGTHGTAEFYSLRYWITRILVEEKGFTHIAFENDLSDTWLLEQELDNSTSPDTLMRKYLLSIWQNEETLELLEWVREYNRTHKRKVRIDGLDYVMLKPDVILLKRLLGNITDPAIRRSLSNLELPAALQDEAWEGMNRKGYRPDFALLSQSSHGGYLLADTLDKKIAGMDIPGKAICHAALVNIKQGFGPFYSAVSQTAEISRDSSMAYNALLLAGAPGEKMIIWAHNAHLAKKGIFNNAVGGAGGHLLKMFPGNYFVLGTGTATGTFSATTEARDTYTNPMSAYPLQQPKENSWDSVLNNSTLPAYYFFPAKYNPSKEEKPLRFIGYNPDSGPKTYDTTNMTDLFDAFLFIKETHASTPLTKLPLVIKQ